MDRKSGRTHKVIELDEKDVKKLQRKQLLEKRRTHSKVKKSKISSWKFSKKDLIVIAIVIIGFFIYYLINNYHIFGLVFNKEITTNDATVLEMINTDNQVFAYKDSVLVFQKNYLTAYDVNGNKEWEKKLEEIFTPDIYISGEYIQITNTDTGYVYVLDGKYEVGRIKLEGNIHSANINSDGTSVIEYSTSGLKTVLGVYNKKGNELYSIKLDNNTVSSYCISDNSRYLAYAYADISGISLVTKITVVDLDRLREQNYEFENIIEKNNELVYKMYWDGNTLCTLFNNSIVKYKATSDKFYEYPLSDINAISMDICDNKIAYITTDTLTSKYVLNVDKYSSKKIGNVEIADAPKYFEYESGLIYICSQKEINIYNKWGIRIKTFESDSTITKPVIFNNGKCVALKISNKIVMFRI